MMAGRPASALRLLREPNNGGVLHLGDEAEGQLEGTTVRDILERKHAPAQPVVEEAIASGESYPQAEFHPVLFEAITGTTIKSASMRTFGNHLDGTRLDGTIRHRCLWLAQTMQFVSPSIC